MMHEREEELGRLRIQAARYAEEGKGMLGIEEFLGKDFSIRRALLYALGCAESAEFVRATQEYTRLLEEIYRKK